MLPEPLHPAIVHFPIVLTFLAPLAAGAALWAGRRGVRPSRASTVPFVALALALAFVGVGWSVGHTGGALADHHGAAQAYVRPVGAPVRPGREREADHDEALRHLEAARLHYALVVERLQALRNDAAGEQMLASTDHLAQVARSLGGAADRDVADLASARATALQLAGGSTTPPPGLAEGVAALRRALDALARPLRTAPPIWVASRSGGERGARRASTLGPGRG